MGDYKKCPEGHVHDSDLAECPYCIGRNIDDDLVELPPGKIDLPYDLAMCYDMGPGNIDE